LLSPSPSAAATRLGLVRVFAGACRKEDRNGCERHDRRLGRHSDRAAWKIAGAPYCANDHYWQVYFDSNRLIRETFGEAGYPSPMPAYSVNGLRALPPDVFAR
jgi:hypothetical protein